MLVNFTKVILYIKIIFSILVFSKVLFCYDFIETAKLNKNTLALGTSQGNLIFLDLESNKYKKIKAHDQAITDISFRSDGQKIASVSSDSIQIRNASLTLLATFDYQANNICFGPKDDKLLISGFALIAIIDPESGAKILDLPHKSTAKASFDSQQELILVSDFNNSLVFIYEIKSKKNIYSISEYWPYHAVFSLDNQKIIISAKNKILVYYLDRFKVLEFTHEKNFAHDHNNWLLQAHANSDGQQVISIDNQGCLLKIDTKTGKIFELGSKKSLKFSAFYDNDQKIILVNHEEVLIYDAKTMELLQNIAIK
jgi:WD40 repeat protein